MSIFFVKLKPAETYTHTHTHTHTHTCNLLLSPKQIGTICFAIFSILISAPLFATGVSSGATSADCDNATLDTYTGTSNLQADWQPNTIALHWYNGDTEITSGVQTSCVYDGALTPPSTIPTKTGYTFAGWRVRQTSNSSSGGSSSCFAGVDASITSTTGGFKNDSTGRYGEWALDAETYGLTLDNTWAEEFTHGIVKGSAKCSANGGTYAMPGVPNDTKGRYCWCRVDSYEPANGNTCIVSNSSWLFSTVHTYAEDCDYECVNNCGIELEMYDSTFRRAVFGVSQ